MQDYAAFEAEVRRFAEAECPEDIRQIVRDARKLTRDPWARWQRVLFDHGWGAPNWPVEHGGTGWDTRQRYIFDTVLAETFCPPQYHHGLRHLGPVLIKYGTEDQRARFLPGILRGEDWWCQGYSEPGSGSDLASLRTRAVREDDHYLVTGQKTWTSHAHEADWIYTLVRTSQEDRKQKGITLLLIPLSSPGIEVRPIRTIDGIHHVNEVFFDNVRVPVANRVGEEGQGWTCGKYLLSHERLGGANTAPIFQLYDAVRRVTARAPEGVLRQADTRLRMIEIESRLLGLREQGRAAVGMAMRGEDLGIVPSAIKVTSCAIQQALCDVAVDTVGPTHSARQGAAGDDRDTAFLRWISTYFLHRSRTIVGGSDEVQKNLVAKQLFGGDLARFAPPMVPGALFDAAERTAGEGAADWGQAVALGWPATLVPEGLGGVGGSLSDLAAVVEGAARGGAALSLPMPCGVTPVLLAGAPAGAARDAALAGLLDGTRRVCTALLTPEGRLDLKDLRTGAAPTGVVGGVEALPDPTDLLLADHDSLVLLPLAGARLSPTTTLDGRPAFDLHLSGVPGTVLAEGSAAAHALSRAAPVGVLMTCVDAVGTMVPVIGQTINYLMQRRQFDQPLAEFQVLRHRVAEMMMTYLNASAATLRALNDMQAGTANPRSLSSAKLRVSRDARTIAHHAIQLHGGMGMTEDLPVTRLNKRLIQAGFDFGDAMLHAERLAAVNL
ncbi:acyl-CoA dehydrogenase family protein [Pseudooceanicola sp. LIPI14-2-Ac024]|uniref:acyl-CoA dehydrogenase family protein n=1 Tax=Pseudooceanicola sp. LIPI14-2-Ac024 TaxID=3344875 RepID=UPI0035D094E7